MTSGRWYFSYLVAVLWSATVSAAPLLSCQVTQADTVQVFNFKPTLDPYSAIAVDVRGNFRFKAVVFGDEQKIEYIKLYSYYLSDRQAVLLHEAKYVFPQPQSDTRPDSLTGMHYLFSPVLGREMQYGCALIEVAP